jgi:hypothetical protein
MLGYTRLVNPDPMPPPNWVAELRREVELEAGPRYLGFRAIMAGLLSIVGIEIGLHVVLPICNQREEARVERAESIGTRGVRSLRADLLNLIPPVIGRQYTIQTYKASAEAARLLSTILDRPDSEKLEILRDAERVPMLLSNADVAPKDGRPSRSDSVIIQLMDLCYRGSPSQAQVEEFIVRSVAAKKLNLDIGSVYQELLANYFLPAQRSEFSGFPFDARAMYDRFLYLVRILAAASLEVSNEPIVQRQMTRAQVRATLLGPKLSLMADSIRTIQTRPIDEVRGFLADPDPSIRALATFTMASLLWWQDKDEAARATLDGHIADCGAIAVECQFLLAKIVEPTDGGQRLASLAKQLPDDHYLLDDVYQHRIWSETDKAKASSLLQEALKRCPHPDRAFTLVPPRVGGYEEGRR